MNARILVASLTLSASALVGIAVHEGYIPQTYLDAVGVPTIGFGHTGDVKAGDRTDPVRALIQLNADASEAAQAVRRCAPVPMYQHEFDAWTSFAFNVGSSAFCRSTAAKKLNAGDYAGACAEMDRWVLAGKRKLPGLVARRAAERALCEGKG